MSGVVMFDGSCEDIDVDDQPTICAWCVRAGRVTDREGASHGICAECREFYFTRVAPTRRAHRIACEVIPRLQSVVARLDGGNYLGASMRSELAADLRGIIARLSGTAPR